MFQQVLMVGLVLAQATHEDDWKEYQKPAGKMIEELAMGRYEEVESRFTPRMKQAVPAATLARIMNPVRTSFGSFKEIVSHRRVSTPGVVTFEILTQFSKSDKLLQFNVSFDSERRIAGLRIIPTEKTAQSVRNATPKPTNEDDWKKHETPIREMIAELAMGRYKEVESRFNSRMKQAVGAEKIAPFFDPIRARVGDFKEIVSHRGGPSLGSFEVLAKFAKSDNLLQINVSFDSEGQIAGMRIIPTDKKVQSDGKIVSRPQFGNYKTKTHLVLPFEGRWTVAHGGRAVEQNHHAANRNQRFAYDFYILGANELSYRTDGKKNEDFYAYGQPVLAPGDGVVVQVVDGVKDNQPGELNPYFVPGNLVVINHGNEEYSFLAHFIPGSLEVKAGDRVRRGQRLGRCGNSGNSSEPHIHYHLANASQMHKGDGLPALFKQVVVDGNRKANSEPVQGNLVSNDEL